MRTGSTTGSSMCPGHYRIGQSEDGAGKSTEAVVIYDDVRVQSTINASEKQSIRR
jgi:hypothetical protein